VKRSSVVCALLARLQEDEGERPSAHIAPAVPNGVMLPAFGATRAQLCRRTFWGTVRVLARSEQIAESGAVGEALGQGCVAVGGLADDCTDLA
jgi:hypothetical protein